MNAKVVGLSRVKVGKEKNEDRFVLHCLANQKNVTGLACHTYFIKPDCGDIAKIRPNDDVEIKFGFNYSIKEVKIINQKG